LPERMKFPERSKTGVILDSNLSLFVLSETVFFTQLAFENFHEWINESFFSPICEFETETQIRNTSPDTNSWHNFTQ